MFEFLYCNSFFKKKYALQLLEKAEMLNCSPASTPVAQGPRFSLHLMDDVSRCTSLVGGLQYSTLATHDLSFA